MSESRLDVQALYAQYGRAIYRRCQYFLRSDAEAQDAMHDVFLKVVERHEEFRGQSSPLTWMVRITTNHCLNLLRSRRAGWRGRYEETVKVDARDRPPDSVQWERHELVRALIGRVNRRALEAAVYYFVDEMSQEDAAAAAGCSVPTLRKRLRDFITLARRAMKEIDSDVVFGPAPV